MSFTVSKVLYALTKKKLVCMRNTWEKKNQESTWLELSLSPVIKRLPPTRENPSHEQLGGSGGTDKKGEESNGGGGEGGRSNLSLQSCAHLNRHLSLSLLSLSSCRENGHFLWAGGGREGGVFCYQPQAAVIRLCFKSRRARGGRVIFL